MARFSHPRRASALKRKAGRKRPRAITLIICEGDSERIYFDAIRAHLGLTATEVIIPNRLPGSAPINLVDTAERKAKEPGGYDFIYCVFDRDSHESFDRARQRLRDLGRRWPMREAISIPCFEVWVLMHFERTDAPFQDCGEVIRRVRQPNHLPEYEKAEPALVATLIERLPEAIANADWLESRREVVGDNPSTSVHHLLRHLQDRAAQAD